MGMSASQARFLSLTARKSNVEFEGQQINQQRTTLSNESASYYSELCNMEVPTPPSVDDYTKVSYTFNDGAMSNTITSILAKGNNEYSISYLKQWQDDYSIVTAVSSLVSNANGVYSVGAQQLRALGQGIAMSVEPAPVQPETTTPTETSGSTSDSALPDYYIPIGTTTKYPVSYDESGNNPSYNMGTLSEYEKLNLGFYTLDASGELDKGYHRAEDGNFYSDDDIERSYPILEDDLKSMDGIRLYTEDEWGQPFMVGIDGYGNYVKLDADGNPVDTAPIPIPEEERGNIVKSNPSTDETNESGESEGTGEAEGAGESEGAGEAGTQGRLAKAVMFSETRTGLAYANDDYIDSLTNTQRKELEKLEQYYLQLLTEKFGTAGWYVRYIKNNTTGSYVPYFYRADELSDANRYTNDTHLGNMNCYSIGSATKTEEVLNRTGKIEKDASGRYVGITLINDDGSEVTYQLNTTTTTDEEAYNDAMNQYKYAQHKYDHRIQEINSKLEIIQQQDKNLELKLKQLDTEENAIQTEMDAVKKVISKNVESSFKTFNA